MPKQSSRNPSNRKRVNSKKMSRSKSRRIRQSKTLKAGNANDNF